MPEDRNELFRRAGWIALLTIATILGSFVFACATPFAALAALAALFLPRRDAFILIGITWAANQVIGFGFLHYPQTWDSFSWGAAMGVAALVATAAAIGGESLGRRFGWAFAAVMTFAISFAANQLVLFAATSVLPAGGGFAPDVIVYVLEVNGLAFAGLLILRGLGRNLGLASARGMGAPSPA
jgi:hypothetical protein